MNTDDNRNNLINNNTEGSQIQSQNYNISDDTLKEISKKENIMIMKRINMG